MKMRFRMYVVALVALAWAGNAHADELEGVCKSVYRTLASGPYEHIEKSMGRYSDDGKTFQGCDIRFSGDISKMTSEQHADRLFGDLGYCPDGKWPATDIYGRTMSGWCNEVDGDGTNSINYRLIKRDMICVVDSAWDAREDDDPVTYVPTNRYDIKVQCSHR